MRIWSTAGNAATESVVTDASAKGARLALAANTENAFSALRLEAVAEEHFTGHPAQRRSLRVDSRTTNSGTGTRCVGLRPSTRSTTAIAACWPIS